MKKLYSLAILAMRAIASGHSVQAAADDNVVSTSRSTDSPAKAATTAISTTMQPPASRSAPRT